MAVRTHQIYGNFSSGFDAVSCCSSIEPTVPPLAVLEQLMMIIQKMKITVERFYPRAMAVAMIIGRMGFSASVPFVVSVRLKWIDQYGTKTIAGENGVIENITVKFDKNSEVHRLQLKDLYLSAGMDWRTDPMFIALGLV